MKNKDLKGKEINQKKNLSSIERRAFLKKAILTTAITAPIIQSFTIDETWAKGNGASPPSGMMGMMGASGMMGSMG